MGKYDALRSFLGRWRVRHDADGVELSYSHIESIIGTVLPRAAFGADWCSAAEFSEAEPPHRRAWFDAGFEAVAKPARECVYFRRRSGGQ